MMPAALPFPEIGPDLFSIEIGSFTFALRWYALAYLVGIVIGWRLCVAAVQRPSLWASETAPLTKEQIDELLTWIVFGVIVGGRLGFGHPCSSRAGGLAHLPARPRGIRAHIRSTG